jgi:predicted TIM-barrel fold metal-dependent hydrolase
LQQQHQDRLEAEGGACIMYTHFGHGFVENGQLKPEFRRTMERLAAKRGWFVPVSALLDFLVKAKGHTAIDDDIRRQLETRWLLEKLFRGTS